MPREKRGLKLITVGRTATTSGCVDGAIDGFAQRLTLAHAGRRLTIRLPLAGAFQVENAPLAAGLVDRDGRRAGARVRGARTAARAPRAGWSGSATSNGAPIFVDYAHKPDALAKALDALRPYVQRPAGGGVRRRRRPRPRQAADDGRASPRENADRVIVTDDNPRSEDPAAIRAAILAAAPGAPRSATAAKRSAPPSPSCSRRCAVDRRQGP